MMEASRYKVEPCNGSRRVCCSSHTGRGGWTWYTGASGWMYNVGIQHILGFKKKADRIIIEPCIPRDWTEYNIRYKHNKNTIYNIIVRNQNSTNTGKVEIILDGKKLEGNEIGLAEDGIEHTAEVSII